MNSAEMRREIKQISMEKIIDPNPANRMGKGKQVTVGTVFINTLREWMWNGMGLSLAD